MARNEQARIRLDKSTKEEWEDAAEEHGRSVSGFVRWCVGQQIYNDQKIDTVQFDDRKLDTVIEEIQSLDSALDGIRHRLQSLETEVKDDPRSRELATAVYGLLPAEGQVTILPDMDDPTARMGENGRIVTGEPRHIAEYIRYSPDYDSDPDSTQVQRALEDLQAELHNVQQLGDGRYYRS